MIPQEHEQYENKVENFQIKEQCRLFSFGEHGFFSWNFCDCCDGKAGNRTETTGVNEVNQEKQVYNLCDDCVYYLNYGRLDDLTMLDIQEK